MMIKHRFAQLCLLLCLGFVGCQDQIKDEPLPNKHQSDEPITEGGDDNTGNYEYITLSIAMEDIGSEALRAGFEQINRPQVEGKDYSFEVSAKLNLTPGDTYQVYLVLVQDGDKTSMHRQRLNFTVLDPKSDYAKGRKNMLYYSGNVTLPKGRSFRDGTWYAMALMHHQYSTIANDTQGGLNHNNVIYGRSQAAPPMANDNTSEFANVSMNSIAYSTETDESTRQGQTYYISYIPYISQWQQLTLPEHENLHQPAHRLALGLNFQPQGVLLHYDLGVNVLENTEIRRFGLYTNTLKFSGEYDLNVESLYARFEGRDKQTGFGLPEWKEDVHRQRSAKLYYQNTPELLSNGNGQTFPWDLPTISQDGFTEMHASTYPQTITTEGSFCDVRVRGWKNEDNARWRFRNVSGGFVPRVSIFFWGMPVKERPDKPFTYLWVGAYDSQNTQNQYSNGDFNPQMRLDNKYKEVLTHRRQIRQWEEQVELAQAQGANVTSAQAQIKAYYEQNAKPVYEAYSQDSTHYKTVIQPAYIKQINETTQPILVLHQTNAIFSGGRERKIHHIRTMLTSDLMITELMQKQEAGNNYSTLELYNPTYAPINLRDYALVRLVDTGDKMLYRKQDGSSTERLADAELFELSTLGDEVQGNLVGNVSPSILVGSPSSRGSWSIASGQYSGQKWIDLAVNVDSQMPLLQQQSIVLGVQGYQTNRADLDNKAWYTPLKRQMEAAKGHDYLRYFAVPQRATGVFDLDAKEGIALLKREGAGWRVIDTTAPIGAESYGFSGTYEAYKAKMESLSSTDGYCLHRKEQVKFPFLPPYRVKKVTTSWSDDWVSKTDIIQATPGSRRVNEGTTESLSIRAPRWFLKRTPMDPSYQTYKQNIPDKSN